MTCEEVQLFVRSDAEKREVLLHEMSVKKKVNGLISSGCVSCVFASGDRDGPIGGQRSAGHPVHSALSLPAGCDLQQPCRYLICLGRVLIGGGE